MSLKFKTCAPNLKTNDIKKTVKFYKSLGFSFILGVEKGSNKIVTKFDEKVVLQFAKLVNGNCALLFDLEGNEFDKDCKIGGSFSLFCGVADDVDIKKLYENIVKDKLAVVKKELKKTFYGKEEFWIEDNNGYVLGIFKDK